MKNSPESDDNARQPRANLRVVPFTGRTLPNSEDAEQYLLSALMLDGPDVMARCHQAKLKPASFYTARHAIVFEVLEELYRRAAPMDVSTVLEELRERKQFDEVGGVQFLTDVSKLIPTTAQASYFIEKVRDTCAMRETVKEFTAGVEAVHGNTGGGEQLQGMLEEKAAWISRCLEFLRSGQATMQTAALAGYTRTLAKLAGNTDKTRWLYTGLAEFDQRFMPFDVNNEDWLCIIAGIQSSGKSSLLRQIVIFNLRAGKTVLIFLLETSLGKWLELAACTAVGVNARHLDVLPADLRKKYEAVLAELHGYLGKTLWICDEIVPIETLTARAEDHARRYGVPSLVGVDHMHLLRSRRQFKAREPEMGFIAKELKRCFKRMHTTGLVLAQLNRGSRTDGNRRPAAHDIRDSGEIEQAADRIDIVHTPDKDIRGAEQTKNQSQVMVELVQDKHRNGPTGHREFWFRRDITCFIDLHDKELNSARATNPAPAPANGQGLSKARARRDQQP